MAPPFSCLESSRDGDEIGGLRHINPFTAE